MSNMSLIHDYARALDEYHEALSGVVNHVCGRKTRRLENLYNKISFPFKYYIGQIRYWTKIAIYPEGKANPIHPMGRKINDE